MKVEGEEEEAVAVVVERYCFLAHLVALAVDRIWEN